MARRGHIGGGRQGFQISPIDFLSGGGGEGNDVTKMAMALMGYGKGGPQDRAIEERQQQAEEMWRQGQLDISRRGEDRQEKAAAAELARQEAERLQHVTERGEDVAYREKVLKSGEEEKAANLRQKEQDAALGTFEKAMEKGYLTDTSGKFTTMGEEWSKDVDPKAVARLQTVAKLEGDKKYGEKLKAYKALTPKQKKALEAPGSEAKIEELGGPEVYQRMLAETQPQAQAKPNLTPGVSTDTGRLPLSRFAEQNAPTAPPSDIFSEAGVRIGLPLVDARDYSKFPGSVEDLIAASRYQTPPEPATTRPVSAPPVALESDTIPADLGGITGAIGDLNLAPARGGIDYLMNLLNSNPNTNIPMPSSPEYPMPRQGVFQPFPG